MYKNNAIDNFHSVVRTRRSIRKFKQEPVPEDKIKRIMESAIWAPSAHNRQQWFFALISSEAVKLKLARGMTDDFRKDMETEGVDQKTINIRVERSQNRLLNAPLVIMAFINCNTLVKSFDEKKNEKEYLMAVQSVAMAGENLMLCAHAEGLGSVWICSPLYTQEAVRNCLELPDHYESIGMILLGYPDEDPEEKTRKPVNDTLKYY